MAPQKMRSHQSARLATILSSLFLALCLPSVAAAKTNVTASVDCFPPKIPFDPNRHKQTYRIAIQHFRGAEYALKDYNLTFQQYLTATAGQRFDPPIEFELVPVTFNELFDKVEVEKSVDLIYANPGSYSCIGVEVGAQPLVTKVSKVEVRGLTYDLDVFGGVIFARADRLDIHSILDLKDKIIGAGAITDIKGGQAQLYEMVLAGMNFVTDPKQVVFTGNQREVVAGVLNGDFDVGMVRTDQIENSYDQDGNQIDPEVFKVLEPKVHVLDSGALFPFLHSTDVFPEWPLASLTHVAADVSTQVQMALLAIAEHARPWEDLVQCKLENTAIDDDLYCDAIFWEHLERCDTTPEIARIAYDATHVGDIDGFRSPRSYFKVRTMQERAGFLTEHPETHEWKCIRAGNLHASLICPPEYYKLTEEEFDDSCAFMGLECKEGYSCYCKPCVKAFEMDLYQYSPGGSAMAGDQHQHDDHALLEHIDGCEKMSICGVMEQQELIYLRAIDNRKRPNATVTAMTHLGEDSHEIPLHKIREFTYELAWSERVVGVGIVEISVDGEQIPESPVRVQVIPRSCNSQIVGANRAPDDEGNCICMDGNVEIGGNCTSTTVLAVTGSILGLIAFAIVGYFVIRHKNYTNDLVWHVNADELMFGDPPEVIGEGAFGVVLLAEYRGTKVAIKKALKNSRSKGSGGGRGSTSGFLEEIPEGAQVAVSLGADTHSSGYLSNPELGDSESSTSEKEDVENQLVEASARTSGVLKKNGGLRGSTSFVGSNNRSRQSGGLDLGFLTDRFGKRGRGGRRSDNFNEALHAIVSTSAASMLETRSSFARLCPWFDEGARREEAFVSEMRLLSSLRHPCICTVMGAVMSSYHTPMLIMEYMEYGSLHDLLRNETMYLSGEIILQVARDVAQGLRYLHTAKPPILHGDLKPANILVDSRFRAKVCDFGLSKKKKEAISGTLFWLAPEYLIGNESYNEACDMYSMGVILNEVYSRTRPYDGEVMELKKLLIDICDGRVNKRPAMAETLPPRMEELVKKLWSRNPRVRPSAKELDTALMDMNVHDAEPMTSDQREARPRTQDMIYEIFPRHIAEALKAGRKVEPENHDLVTIVFSDIKGFTDISQELPPMKVSMMLDRLYLAFDKIARKHGVFKVETIGDAYMGVTNLVENQEDTHVKQIAEFAIDMINEAGQILVDEEEPEKGYIRIRVGFHSGPVVANVIGSLNPRYGLFGDTVNTASRMESNSAGSRILCSEASYAFLKRQAPNLSCTSRGKIPVKGKGDMVTYWVGDDLIRKNRRKRRKSMAMRRLGSVDSDCTRFSVMGYSGLQFQGAVRSGSSSTAGLIRDISLAAVEDDSDAFLGDASGLGFDNLPLGKVASAGSLVDLGKDHIRGRESRDSSKTSLGYSEETPTLHLRGKVRSHVSLASLVEEKVKLHEKETESRETSSIGLTYSEEEPQLHVGGKESEGGKESTGEGDGNDSSGDERGSRTTAVTAESDDSPEVFIDEPGVDGQGSKDIDGTGGFVPPLGRFHPGVTDC